MDVSADVAKLLNSLSCLPKCSDGQEMPAGFQELWGVEYSPCAT